MLNNVIDTESLHSTSCQSINQSINHDAILQTQRVNIIPPPKLFSRATPPQHVVTQQIAHDLTSV
jgi:hypothetical protein